MHAIANVASTFIRWITGTSYCSMHCLEYTQQYATRRRLAEVWYYNCEYRN